MRKATLRVTALFAGFAAVGATAEECSFEIARAGAVAASATDRIVVDAGSGHLRVVGRYGQSEVRVVGAVCASQARYLEDLRVTVERRGAEVGVRAHYPDPRSASALR